MRNASPCWSRSMPNWTIPQMKGQPGVRRMKPRLLGKTAARCQIARPTAVPTDTGLQNQQKRPNSRGWNARPNAGSRKRATGFTYLKGFLVSPRQI